jgi:hypothetical protein
MSEIGQLQTFDLANQFARKRTSVLARRSNGGSTPAPVFLHRGRHDGFTATNEMLFTPNFLLAPRALSEMNW